MRNPLSAILQCADEIATSLGEARVGRKGRDVTVSSIVIGTLVLVLIINASGGTGKVASTY